MSASYTLIYAVYGVVAHGKSTIQHIMIVRVVCGTRVLARLWKIDTHILLPTKRRWVDVHYKTSTCIGNYKENSQLVRDR